MQRSAKPTPKAEFLPGICDLYAYAGDDADWIFEFTDDDTGDPIDLSGAAAIFQARAMPSSTATIFALSSPSGGISIAGPAGEITVTVPDTEAYAGMVMYYDLQLTSAGQATTYIAGRIHWEKDVSRISSP